MIYIRTLVNILILLALSGVIPLSCQNIDCLTSIDYFLQTISESPMADLVICALRLKVIHCRTACNQHKQRLL